MKRIVTPLAVLAALFISVGTLAGQAASQAAPASNEIVVPDGTVLPIVLTSFLNTRGSQPGDTFYSETVYPVWIRQRLVIPRGSLVKGIVTDVERPGRIRGKGRLAIRLDTILLPNGVERNLRASFRGIHGPGTEKIDRRTESIEMDSSKGVDTGEIIGTTAQGALIGAISGRGKGAGIGAGAGAAVGLATVLFTRGRELILEPGTQFDVELKQPLSYSYGEIDFASAPQMDDRRRYDSPRPRYNRDHDHRPYDSGRRRFPGPWFFPVP